MASQPRYNLDSNQQGLLLAALNSQASKPDTVAPSNLQNTSSTMSLTGDNLYISPQSAGLDNFGDFTPELDYLDGDNSFDFDNAELGGDMIGALPGSEFQHDKRKSPDENGDAENGDAKRQETQDGGRQAKKPGRKPLTSEPTTKRKAQNRAAQRAFRERKEQHLKDLETKVTELTKTTEADKHENGLLRAQVDRLQTELREYRKRLSLNGTAHRSPPTTGMQQRSNSGSNYGGNQFAFDFPKFGALPGSLMLNNQTQNGGDGIIKRESVTPPALNQSRHNSQGGSMSPIAIQSLSNSVSPQTQNAMVPSVGFSTVNNMHGFASTLPQMNETDPFGGLFSPSILNNAGGSNYFGATPTAAPVQNTAPTAVDGGESTAGFSRAFQFNSGSSMSDSASPSGSSMSHWQGNGTSSSCGTSPEPSHDSPGTKEASLEKGSGLRNSTSQAEVANTPSIFGTGDFNVPTSTTFDPTLFGDYRDASADNLFGTTDFNNSFFDDALGTAPFDLGSPSNLFGILQSPPSTNSNLPASGLTPAKAKPCEQLIEEMEKARDGGDDDYGLPTTQPKKDETKLISCNNIWNQLQSNPDFQEGKFDLDGLCSELRTKAKCSESGVMVDQDHVEAALRKLGKKDVPAKEAQAPQWLMFEQESWDNVLKKMNGNNKA